MNETRIFASYHGNVEVVLTPEGDLVLEDGCPVYMTGQGEFYYRDKAGPRSGTERGGEKVWLY